MSGRLSFDVIGDVHGQYEKLLSLLVKLGYRRAGGAWRHPGRTAVFVGDLIDRGALQVATVALVRQMVEAGAARSILGNHEFNAIAFATSHPENHGKFLRDRERPGIREQHHAFLQDVGEDSHEHREWVAWFKTLPLWLDLGGVRIVHACWHQESIDKLQPLVNHDHTLTDELLVRASTQGHWAYDALEIICKGPEVALPEGRSFIDAGGKVRHKIRVRWWQEDLPTYRKAAIGPAEEIARIPDLPMPAHGRRDPYCGPPVLFGHYWFTGNPTVISRRFACLDFSAASGGSLVAYRWNGESGLSSANLVWV